MQSNGYKFDNFDKLKSLIKLEKTADGKPSENSVESNPWDALTPDEKESLVMSAGWHTKDMNLDITATGRKVLGQKWNEMSEGAQHAINTAIEGKNSPDPSGERAPSFETFSAIEKKLKKDEYTSADELKKDFQFFLDNKDSIIKSIREYLDTDERYKRKRSATKDEIAKNAYSQSLDLFAGAGGDMLSWCLS